MKYAQILGALVFGSISLLIAPERQSLIACAGSSGSVCTVTTTTCLKSMVMSKSSPGVVLLPPSTAVTFSIPVKLFLIINNPAPGCGPCASPVSPTSARIDMTVSPLQGGPTTATAFISTAAATMVMPAGSPGGSFNNYSVPITVPIGTAAGAYKVVGKTTVNFSDGLSLNQSGDTVVCLVDPAPGNPGVPRLDLQLLTPASPMMAGGDQHTATYRIRNNDPVNSVTVTAFATAKQAAVRPQGANEMQGVFAIANPFGDDFPIAFGPGPCIPLPGHPYFQPPIMMGIPPIAPNSFFDVFVEIRSYGMCASGSCSESTLRVDGTFADNSPAFACAAMALYVDTSQPPTTCLPRTDDCNNNNIPDAVEIANGMAPDTNYNSMIDACENGQSPIIVGPVQVNPPTVLTNGQIQVQVTAHPDFGMPTTRFIQIVLANGVPLNTGDQIHWQGVIPADSRPGPQTVYVIAKENNGAIATHIGVYNTVLPPPPQSAVSRKTHGAAGDRDIALALTGTPGIECRSGGTTNDYTMVVTWANPITVSGNPQAQVTSGSGTIGTGGVSNGGMVTLNGNTVTVPLTNIANAQTINVTLFGVVNGPGSSDVVIPMSLLLGDTSGNGTVTSTDISQTKGQVGQAVGTNFRTDTTVNGTITSTDVSLVKNQSGTALP
jgi:hypothetical protein